MWACGCVRACDDSWTFDKKSEREVYTEQSSWDRCDVSERQELLYVLEHLYNAGKSNVQQTMSSFNN